MPEPKQMDRRNFLRRIRDISVVAAVGGAATALTACAPKTVEAGPATQPTKQPSPDASKPPKPPVNQETTRTPESYSLDLTSSQIYADLPEKMQKVVAQAVELDFDAKDGYNYLPADTRVLTGLILAQANKEAYGDAFDRVYSNTDSSMTELAIKEMFADIYAASPSDLKSSKKDTVVPSAINTPILTASQLAFNASKLADGDPGKKQMVDIAKKITTSMFEKPIADEHHNKDVVRIVKDLIDRIDAVAGGDESQLYTISVDTSNELPTSSSSGLEGDGARVKLFTDRDPIQFIINPPKAYYGMQPDSAVRYTSGDPVNLGGDTMLYLWRLDKPIDVAEAAKIKWDRW